MALPLLHLLQRVNCCIIKKGNCNKLLLKYYWLLKYLNIGCKWWNIIISFWKNCFVCIFSYISNFWNCLQNLPNLGLWFWLLGMTNECTACLHILMYLHTYYIHTFCNTYDIFKTKIGLICISDFRDWTKKNRTQPKCAIEFIFLHLFPPNLKGLWSSSFPSSCLLLAYYFSFGLQQYVYQFR